MWSDSLSTLVFPTLSTVVFFFVTVNIVKFLIGEYNIHKKSRKMHDWQVIDRTSRAHFCSICESLIIPPNGLSCDSCGICTHLECIKLGDKTFKCKEISANLGEVMTHHWIKGNLPLTAVCDKCKQDCCIEQGLLDWWCCWCQRCAHDTCKVLIEKKCDLGTFRSLIIPPVAITVIKKRSKFRRYLKLKSIQTPVECECDHMKWTPLLVFANNKSGNNEGSLVLSSFRRFLNPIQVVDLSIENPTSALEMCQVSKFVQWKIMVAGGDGSVAWILDSIYKMQLSPVPFVGIIPLGTGNDLSRVLNWGKEYDPSVEITKTLQEIVYASTVKLDRWLVSIDKLKGFQMAQKKLHMYNYLSIGVDAQVTLNFHKTRESRFYLFSHRIFNKLLYLCFGTHQIVEREYKNLDQKIILYLDDRVVQLPSIESIVILNIPSWGAGVDLWNLNVEDQDYLPPQSISDKKIEVVALYSSLHIAQLQVGMSQAVRLGQANSVKVKLFESCAMQVDGEPWMQAPSVFSVKHVDQALVLKNIQ